MKSLNKITSFLLFVSILSSCSFHTHRYYDFECLDFAMFAELKNELSFQNSFDPNGEFVLFDFTNHSSSTSYHLCGENHSDDFIESGIDVPDGKVVLFDRSPFILNKTGEEELAIAFSTNRPLSKKEEDYTWVIVDSIETYDISSSEYSKVQTKECDRFKFYYNKVSFSPVTYALVDSSENRYLWVTHSLGEEGFNRYKNNIIELYFGSF